MVWEYLLNKLNNPQEESIAEIIMNFLSSRIPESTVIDYKSHVDLTSNEGKKKLTKWIAGMANARGGMLVLGVHELENTGKPDIDKELVPVQIPERTELIQHITNIINGTLNPIPAFYPYSFNTGGGQAAMIIIPASNNRPHVVEMGEDRFVPIRSGTSTPKATREELDMMYREKQLIADKLNNEAREQFEKNCPNDLTNKPICYIYAVPVGTPPNLIDINTLKASDEYKKKAKGSPRIEGLYALPDSREWKAGAGIEAGRYDYPSQRTSYEVTDYRAIAYRNGTIATWALITDSSAESYSLVLPQLYLATLHGTLAPWLSFLAQLGLTTTVEGRVILQNIEGRYPYFHPENIRRADRYIIKDNEVMLPFTLFIPTTEEKVRDECFRLFSELIFASGNTIDFSDREIAYVSELENAIMGSSNSSTTIE